MAWIPLAQTGADPDIYFDNETVTFDGSIFTSNGGLEGQGAAWEISTPWPEEFDRVRISVISYENRTPSGNTGGFIVRDPSGEFVVHPLDWVPGYTFEVLFSDTYDGQGKVRFRNSGSDSEVYFSDAYTMLVELWVDDPDPPPSSGYKVYELDKGWSFDGNYIPHFLEMNWYFGDDPFTDKTIQKVRIHGLAKGLAQLQLSVAGMQHEYDSDYTEPQLITLPRNAATISSEYMPTTNYVDSSNWGVSIQLKFEGSNTDLTKPEPSHVLQVLALQGSPQENGRRIN